MHTESNTATISDAFTTALRGEGRIPAEYQLGEMFVEESFDGGIWWMASIIEDGVQTGEIMALDCAPEGIELIWH